MKKKPPFVLRRIIAIFVVLVLFVFSLGVKVLGGITLGIIVLIILFGPKFFLGVLLGFFFVSSLISLVFSGGWHSRGRDDN